MKRFESRLIGVLEESTMASRVSIVSALAGCVASLSAFAQDAAPPPGASPNPDSSGVPSAAPSTNAAAPPDASAAQVPQGSDATAEAATTQAAKPHDDNRMVEEIVVTAQKREENLQQVPISVQAFSGANLD